MSHSHTYKVNLTILLSIRIPNKKIMYPTIRRKQFVTILQKKKKEIINKIYTLYTKALL